MAFIIKDRVKEGTVSTGTGAVTLGGASATFDPFNSYMVDGDTTYYAIVHTTSGVDEWEVGIGTWNTGNTLTRTTILSGSNGTSAVDFSSGTKNVFMTYPASKALYADVSGEVTLPDALHVMGQIDGATYIEAETHLDLNTTTQNKPSHREGRIFYDAAFGALAVYNDEADITLQVGQEEYIRVKNNSGATIANGMPVYLTGEDQSTPTIALAKADGTYAESQAVGVATHDIENNSVGYITVRGLIADVDTSHLTVGEKVHVDVGGGTTTTAPSYPYFATDVGICLISAASGGCIYVYVETHAFETLRVTNNAYFDGNVTVAGDITVLGDQVTASSSNIAIGNAWNYFNAGDTIGALNTAFSGTGLDDASLTGHFTGTTPTSYYVRIDGVGTGTGGVDTFEWSTDNFATTVATNVDITGDDQLIHSTDNIAIKFEATTGHTLGDTWTGTAAPVNVDTGFASNRNTGTTGVGYTHVGIYYDVSTNKWTVFDAYAPEPEGVIDTTDSSFSYGTLKAGTFEGNLDGNVTGNVTGNVAGSVTGSLTGNVTGNVTGNLTGDVTGNADTATALETARTIQLTGDVIGSATFDGSANAVITATVQDDSHSHVISNVDGLQTALDSKADDTTTISAGTGLTGGGSIGVNRTISLDTSYTDTRYVNATGDTMSGSLSMGDNNVTDIGKLNFENHEGTDYGVTGDVMFDENFYADAEYGAAWSSSNGGGLAVYNEDGWGRILTDRNIQWHTATFDGLKVGSNTVFHDGYHPNADKWTTARTLSLSGDASGSVSWDGSANATLSVTVADNSHSHNNYTPIDHMRSTGNSYYTSTTTSALLSEVLGDGAFNSYFSTHKTGWSYAGNGNLTDAGRLTELAGTSWAWWTDNSGDGTQGNVTALAIAPNTGGSAGKVFIYNNQGSSYAPGWREVWTSKSDGSGSGLDADLLDGVQGSSFLRSDASDVITGDNRSLSFGTPGAGATTGARFLSIEGNSDSSGEGSGRLFFTEHNSTTASMDNYGFSIGYRGGDTNIVGASGNTWTGLTQIGNGEWGMWGHDDSAAGALIMHGDRAGTYVDFSGNNIQGVSTLNATTEVATPLVDTTTVQIGSLVTLSESADRADLLQISSSTTGWAGLQIRNTSNEGRWSFMTDGENAGIYNDEDNNWAVLFHETSDQIFYRAGSEKLRIRSDGIDVSSHIYIDGNIYHNGDTDTYIGFHAADQWRVVTGGVERLEVNNSDILASCNLRMSGHVIDMVTNEIQGTIKIVAYGDTNTYTQFHAADQWRVVTGGAERLEVNNSQITSTEPIHAPSFHGNGSALTNLVSGLLYAPWISSMPNQPAGSVPAANSSSTVGSYGTVSTYTGAVNSTLMAQNDHMMVRQQTATVTTAYDPGDGRILRANRYRKVYRIVGS